MLKFAQTIFLLVVCLIANTQTHHFIYIENSNKQPFTAQLNGVTYEATTKNFVIIPKLSKGTYNFTISTLAASNKKFTVTIDDIDLGFVLKQNTGAELMLFDINRFATIEQDGAIKPIANEPITIVKEVEKPVKIEEKPIVKPVDTIAKATIKIEKNVQEAIPETVGIKKIYQKKIATGIDEVYVDFKNGKIDTISIFIPFEKIKKDTVKQLTVPPVIEQKPDTIVAAPAPVVVLNNCVNKATEREVADFSAKIQDALMLKHKLKLAAATLKEKCFSVNQIKRLGVLFLNESGKFNFYKLAQTAVTDVNDFFTLEKELKDEKIKEEFRALLK